MLQLKYHGLHKIHFNCLSRLVPVFNALSIRYRQVHQCLDFMSSTEKKAPASLAPGHSIIFS